MHKDPAYRKKQHDHLVEWFKEGKEEMYIDEVFGSRWQLNEIIKGIKAGEEDFYHQWYNAESNDDPGVIESCDFIHPGFRCYEKKLTTEQKVKMGDLVAQLRAFVKRKWLTYDNLMVHPKWAFKWAAEAGLLRICEIIAVDFMTPMSPYGDGATEKIWGPYILKPEENTGYIWAEDVKFNASVKRLKHVKCKGVRLDRTVQDKMRFIGIYANYKGPVMAQSSQLPLS